MQAWGFPPHEPCSGQAPCMCGPFLQALPHTHGPRSPRSQATRRRAPLPDMPLACFDCDYRPNHPPPFPSQHAIPLSAPPSPSGPATDAWSRIPKKPGSNKKKSTIINPHFFQHTYLQIQLSATPPPFTPPLTHALQALPQTPGPRSPRSQATRNLGRCLSACNTPVACCDTCFRLVLTAPPLAPSKTHFLHPSPCHRRLVQDPQEARQQEEEGHQDGPRRTWLHNKARPGGARRGRRRVLML
jgi:hypothetical protein